MAIEEVILVDENDREKGVMEKIDAHRRGLLHRAFSVFVVNESGQLLLQKRASGKYHSANLWTNTCCSHPRPGEDTEKAASRRLREEMGIECRLFNIFSFIYRADLENGLTEHEFDHVLIGTGDDLPVPDPDEVSEYKYVDFSFLDADLNKNADKYTIWFRIAYPRVRDHLIKYSGGADT
jgi:isopentenyl-diphosphate Delta-isomerase